MRAASVGKSPNLPRGLAPRGGGHAVTRSETAGVHRSGRRDWRRRGGPTGDSGGSSGEHLPERERE